MHFRAASVALLGFNLLVQATKLNKRALLDDCLRTSGVPTDSEGSVDWQSDVAPFNLRLQYNPAAIAVPRTVRHVQDTISCAAKVGYKTNAKCGGHSYASFGLGGEDDHLTIAMDRMNRVTLDNTTGIASGRRAFSHGTCPGVGVGGHALHGGYGVSSHTKGLALDWMMAATVVLANSTVVNCSQADNPELFWAIRGAGSSMGVVTSFQFKTFRVPEKVTFFAAPVRWTEESAVSGLRALQDYAMSDMPNELNMRLFITRSFANLEGLFYGDKAGLQTTLQPLLEKTGATLALAQTGDWLDQLSHFGSGIALNQTHPYDMHETFYSSSLYTKPLTSIQIRELVASWFNSGKSNMRDWYAQIDLHGGKNSAVASVSADSTAYAHRDYVFMINCWGQYINYPDPNLDRTTAQTVYWGPNLAKLQKIKAMLDPGDLFYYPQGVAPSP
ncbi:FAD-binding domain-containing protein [Pleurostoma richardsiae]|uniref:FAD-binding domain-containing protein n=1 Tax=Pleurostoma richardsiae TaxID=41990 RepID=A0AA38VC20_9PEZI|nr:FAD-binding domain-containing protein [Pleurostoma richardsiae]